MYHKYVHFLQKWCSVLQRLNQFVVQASKGADDYIKEWKTLKASVLYMWEVNLRVLTRLTDRETENWGEGKHWTIAVDHSRKRGEKTNGRGREKQLSPICRYVLTSLFSFLSYTYSHITDDCDAFRKDTDRKKWCTRACSCSHIHNAHTGV